MTDLAELAKLLGTTKEQLSRLDEEMSTFTGKKDVPQKLLKELDEEQRWVLARMGSSDSGGRASPPAGRARILVAFRERVEAMEEELVKVLKQPDCRTQAGCQFLIETAQKLGKPAKGFFLKEKKARELLLANPPENAMDALGYTDATEMLEKEDLFEVFASLRFVEESRWLNEVFFVPFQNLTPNDFEKREIQIRVLGAEKWGRAAAAFMRKKYHNLSHLKELGVVFTIPVEPAKGITLRCFSLLLHYLHEVSFYARYFEQCAKEPESFTENLLAALRGDVRGAIPPIENLCAWLVIQRYLAKDDPDDPRLAIPHVSSEALFWKQATDELGRFGDKHPELGFSLWAGKAHVAGMVDGKLTSFNFEDNVFSAIPDLDVEQYIYHVREALWNRLFTLYLDEKALETLLVEGFGQGFIGFRIRNTEG